MNNIDAIIKMLEQEREWELACAIETRILMRKTLNPVKRIRLKLQAQMFMDHALGIGMCIRKVKNFKTQS